MKPREYNWDRKTKKLTKISEKGGDYLHYVHHGSTDAEGNFVPEELTYQDINGDFVSVETKEQLEARLRQEGVDVLDVATQGVGYAADAVLGAEKGLKNAGGSWGKTKKGLKHYESGWHGNQQVGTQTGKQIAEELSNKTSRLGKAAKWADALVVGRVAAVEYTHHGRIRIGTARAAAEYGGGRVGGALGAWGAGSLGAPLGPGGAIAAGIAGRAAGAEAGSRAVGAFAQEVYEWFWERPLLAAKLIEADAARGDAPTVTE